MDDAAEFHLLLLVCDGYRGAHPIRGDDALGMIALAHDVHGLGFSCWLVDTLTGELVASSEAGCFACEREGECDFPGDPAEVGSPWAPVDFIGSLMFRLARR